jgi:transcriptional regulator with XRE-family HTH domain
LTTIGAASITISVSARTFKKERLAKGYSQSQLARELDVDVMTISRWERGVMPIPRMAELALSSLKPKLKKEE